MMKEHKQKFGPRELEGELEISDFNEWALKYQVSTLYVETYTRDKMDYDKLSIIQDHQPITLKNTLIIASHEVRDSILETILK